MVNFGKFFHTETGKYVMSLLLGFGLASLFRNVCKDKNCIIFHAPPLDQINDKIYKFDNKCYKYDTVQTKCNNNGRKIVDFA
jgi:hypothetical protein